MTFDACIVRRRRTGDVPAPELVDDMEELDDVREREERVLGRIGPVRDAMLEGKATLERFGEREREARVGVEKTGPGAGEAKGEAVEKEGKGGIGGGIY